MKWQEILKMGGRNTKKEKALTDYFDNLSIEEIVEFMNNFTGNKRIMGVRFVEMEEQPEEDGMTYLLWVENYLDDEESYGGVRIYNDGSKTDSNFEIRDKAPEQDYGGDPNSMYSEWRSEAGY
mgnify:CR=1 FL=1